MLIDAGLWAGPVQYALREVVTALRNQLTLDDNVSQVTATITTPSTPGTSFSVAHGLGRVPLRYIANLDADCNLWSINKSSWTDTTMQLACSGSSVELVLTIL